MAKTIGLAALGIVAAVAIIYGALSYQKSHKPDTSSLTAETTMDISPQPSSSQSQGQDSVQPQEAASQGLKTTPSGLQYADERIGTGAIAQPGNTVSVNYLGTLTNGTKFDSSYDRGEPFSFLLGAGQVIKGWDEGVAGMRVGGKRKLVIPADLAYGNQAVGSVIPANSVLVFEVELLGVK
jgi:peptidylprolyl isomerase